jgi:hypothetical protein
MIGSDGTLNSHLKPFISGNAFSFRKWPVRSLSSLQQGSQGTGGFFLPSSEVQRRKIQKVSDFGRLGAASGASFKKETLKGFGQVPGISRGRQQVPSLGNQQRWK